MGIWSEKSYIPMNNTFQMRSFLRFLERNKLYTAINIFGFAVSLMFVALLTVYIQKEAAVDDYHVNKERIYRLQHSGGTHYSAAIPAVIENRLPEVEATTRVFGFSMIAQVPGSDKERLRTSNSLLVDSTFFSMFTWSFTEGDPTTVMHTKQDVVLSETFARKLFGDEPAMGKNVNINGNDEYRVSGVIRDIEDSHFNNADIFMPFANLGDFWGQSILTEFNANSFMIYVLARPNADLPAKAPDLEAHFHELDYWLFSDKIFHTAEFKPLAELYYSPGGNGETRANDRTFLTVLAVTALVILIFAVINYINLSVAQTGFRAGEAAMRRLLGGSRRQLIVGLITESVLLCALSLVVALGLASVVEPLFQQMFATDMVLAEGLTGRNIALMVGGVVGLGVISGLVPALTITSFAPIDVVRGTFRRRTKMVFSKVLITFQYAITIVLIGCTIVIVRQVNSMTRSDMGFNQEQIVVSSVGFEPSQYASYRDQLMAIPGVEQVAYAQGVPPTGGNNNTFTDKDGVNHSFTIFRGDTAYLSMLGFEVLSRTGVEDADAVWLNETAWRQLGLADDATQYNNSTNTTFKIRGKVKDFHIEDFSQSIGEAVIQPMAEGNWAWQVLVKVSLADPFGTMEQIRKIYNERRRGNLFDGQFLDQSVQQLYQKQTRMSQILGSLSLLAIVISALGMLAMSTYFVRQRAGEVAVRKVFGAKISQVLGMLMVSFLKLVGIAFVIAVPVIWYLMREWLAGYAYRISLGWEIFAAAGAIAFAIAAATVLWQSLLAANTNPIASIRD